MSRWKSAVLILGTVWFAFNARAGVARAELANHVIAADRDGIAIHPETERPFLTTNEFETFVNGLLDRAEQMASVRFEGRMPVPVKILVHVHGGLNSSEDTSVRVEKFTPVILKENEDWHYPIFVRWPSGFGSTYWEHLVSVRQGNKAGVWGTVSAPFVFVTDLLQFIAHAPTDWYYQCLNAKDRSVIVTGPPSWLTHSWKVADRNALLMKNLRRGRYEYEFLEDRVFRTSLDAVQEPVRITVGTLAQGTVAEQSWKNMKRRTRNMVYPAPLFETIKWPETADAVRGRSPVAFFHLLNQRATQKTNTFNYEITFVGHSMGAIVLNNIFTEFRPEWIESQTIKEIIYMAGACTISDTVNALKPLLLAYNTNAEPNEVRLKFHNLTLNRVAEIGERMAHGFIPRGSLLEYIDQHLENPEAPMNRTMGTEVNVLSAIHAFDEVQPWCEFKSFDRVPKHIPSAHSDFGECPFWRRSFWDKDEVTFTGENGREYNCYQFDWLKTDAIVNEVDPQKRPRSPNRLFSSKSRVRSSPVQQSETAAPDAQKR